MKIVPLSPAEAPRLVPLLLDLHQLHVDHQPARHKANPDEAALITWLTDWIAQDAVHALAAESPQGGLLGYVIFEEQERPDLPVIVGGTRVYLHHIAVKDAMRGMGIGKALVSAVKAHAQSINAVSLQTTYAPFNTASAGLMQAMGLEPVIIQAELRL